MVAIKWSSPSGVCGMVPDARVVPVSSITQKACAGIRPVDPDQQHRLSPPCVQCQRPLRGPATAFYGTALAARLSIGSPRPRQLLGRDRLSKAVEPQGGIDLLPKSGTPYKYTFDTTITLKADRVGFVTSFTSTLF